MFVFSMFLHISTFWVLCILGEQNNSLSPISWDCLQSGSRCYLWNSGNFLGSDVKNSSTIHLDNFLSCPNCPNPKTVSTKNSGCIASLTGAHCPLSPPEASDWVWHGLKSQHEHRTRSDLRSNLAMPGFGSQNMMNMMLQAVWAADAISCFLFVVWQVSTTPNLNSTNIVIDILDHSRHRRISGVWNNVKWCKM